MNFVKSCFFAQRFHDDFRLDEFDLSQHFVFMFETENGRIFLHKYDQDNKMFLLEIEKKIRNLSTFATTATLTI